MAGRKRKQGARTKSGRLSRGAANFDRGTEKTRERMAAFGTDGADAIGRAYRAGLLGPDADNLKNAAKAVFRAYWPMLAVGVPKSCLGAVGGVGGANNGILDGDADEHEKRREIWLTETLRSVDRMGVEYRRAFDGLCIDPHGDSGPAWLDGVIWAKARRRKPDPRHARQLRLALEALELITGN